MSKNENTMSLAELADLDRVTIRTARALAQVIDDSGHSRREVDALAMALPGLDQAEAPSWYSGRCAKLTSPSAPVRLTVADVLVVERVLADRVEPGAVMRALGAV